MPIPNATPRPLPEGAHVLVVRLSALGDVLFALETVAALRAERPDVRVDFLVEDRFAGVLADHPDLRAVRTLPRRGGIARIRALWALARGPRYDAVLDVHGLLKSALPARFVRTRRRIGFAPPLAKEGAHRFYTETVEVPRPTPHRAEQGLHLLRALGLRGDARPARLGSAVPPAELAHTDGPLVILHPGTSAFAAFKRWPIERFAELAARLSGEGVRVGVSFGPGEQDLADAIRAAAPASLPLDGAALGLLRLAAGYRTADVVVAADTGPLHIAAAAGARVLALFGPKDTNLYGPRDHGAGHRVLHHDVPCRPCRRRRCASPVCILGLDVDSVHAEVRNMLERKSR
jgi:heptosyltransferase-1